MKDGENVQVDKNFGLYQRYLKWRLWSGLDDYG